MILVTGAGGKTGRAVVRALRAGAQRVRALVRDPDHAAELRDLGAADIIVGDLLDAEETTRAMDGVRAVYLIAPNVHPKETHIGRVALASAREEGVEHFVYHSVLHPQTREMPHHWQKLAVEEALFESDLAYTILQPCAYMQNLMSYWDTIVGEGEYRVPYGEAAALSLVDLEDVAEVAAKALTDPTHAGAVYELAGPEALTPSDIVGVLGDCLGRPVEATRQPIEEWVDQAQAAGLGEYAVGALAKMFRYYDRYGLEGNPQVLTWLLGRPPTTLREFVGRAHPAP